VGSNPTQDISFILVKDGIESSLFLEIVGQNQGGYKNNKEKTIE
jgi:hypothetical protein